MDHTVIDLEALKNKYKNDSIPHHIWSMALDCKRRRDAFWHHSRRMHWKANLISIPLLILSSLTGLTSVAQLGVISTQNPDLTVPTDVQKQTKGNMTLSIIVTATGVSTAVLTAFQRYFRYAERCEHANLMAKNYARIARRIENMMVLVESNVATIAPNEFRQFIEDIQKDIDSLMQEINEMPRELLHKKRYYKTMIQFVKSQQHSTPTTEEVREMTISPVRPTTEEVREMTMSRPEGASDSASLKSHALTE